jgi:hypothetical protein
MREAVENITDRSRNVVILSPEKGDYDVPTDEEDFGEDPEDIGQLEVAGEVEVVNSSSDGEDEESEPPNRWRKRPEFNKLWEAPSPIMNLDSQYPALATLSEYKLWAEIFDENISQLILRETLLYARRDKGALNFALSEEDLMAFLGITILSGYHTLPSERDYWSNQPDMGVGIVKDTMSRDRFGEIKRHIHLVDNMALPRGDKFAKVSKLYQLLNEALQI